MHQGDDGTRCEPRVKPDHDVEQDADRGVDHGKSALHGEFFTDLRADIFDATQFDIGIRLMQR